MEEGGRQALKTPVAGVQLRLATVQALGVENPRYATAVLDVSGID